LNASLSVWELKPKFVAIAHVRVHMCVLETGTGPKQGPSGRLLRLLLTLMKFLNVLAPGKNTSKKIFNLINVRA